MVGQTGREDSGMDSHEAAAFAAFQARMSREQRWLKWIAVSAVVGGAMIGGLLVYAAHQGFCQ